MKTEDKLIEEVIKTVNWERVQYFHKIFDIKWQFQEKEGYIIEKIPMIIDLKEELRTLLRFIIKKDMPVLEYGNWILSWNSDNEAMKLEAIFVLEDAIASSATDAELEINKIENLKKKLETALNNEFYEDAATLRDKILYLEKEKVNK